MPPNEPLPAMDRLAFAASTLSYTIVPATLPVKLSSNVTLTPPS